MELSKLFHQYPKVALAFSGGVDSAYLLYAAIKYGADVRAYYVKSVFQPQFELEDARHMAKCLNADLTIIEADVLSAPNISHNRADRCYHCKKFIFSKIAAQALKDGYEILLDGSNASDSEEDRPGMRAIKELSVISPLRECNLTKEEIRLLSKDAGLFTWNKPAYACLATRIPTGEVITKEKLEQTEHAEVYLSSLGFSDFRVRMAGTSAKIQVPSSQLYMIIEKKASILQELKKYYSSILLDLEARNE